MITISSFLFLLNKIDNKITSAPAGGESKGKTPSELESLMNHSKKMERWEKKVHF